MDGNPICLNGDTIEDVDALGVHPDIVKASDVFESQIQDGELPLCHKAVQVNGSDDPVICISKQIPVTIRSNVLTRRNLSNALELIPTDMHSSHDDVCTECLYKIVAASHDL
jgi:hypothetical protein